MVFSSISFIFFILPLFLVADRLASYAGAKWRNFVLLTVSLLFYIWGEPVNVLVLLAFGVINYFGGRRLPHSARPRLVLAVLITVNLLILFSFKYLGWLISLVNSGGNPLRAALPLGISFFTFHAISYVIDIYRKDIEPALNISGFMTYFCMFPHLVAGPIVRYRHIENELEQRAAGTELFNFGMYKFLLGVNKKVLIANTVAPLADAAFSPLIGAGGMIDAWLGILAYTLQIYFDFSAYSDMAIGLAAMAGFRFAENFARPYSAVNVRDFWRRWHISLSSWFRDYVYIPLGGNRAGPGRTVFNLLLVFFLCGLWHGADVTFVAWGLWHGLFLILEREPGRGGPLSRLPATILGRCYTLLVVTVGWVFFRADSFGQALEYLTLMFSPAAWGGPEFLSFNRALIGVAAGLCLCLIPDKFLPNPGSHQPSSFAWPFMALQGGLFFFSLAQLVSGSRSPFIYFYF